MKRTASTPATALNDSGRSEDANGVFRSEGFPLPPRTDSLRPRRSMTQSRSEDAK